MSTMETPHFARRVEDFRCARCGTEVRGDGFTNHCPRCLWSRHVDVAPGDRRDECRGMMRPVVVEPGRKAWTIVHRCESCGFERRNRSAPADDYDALLAVAASDTPDR